MYLNLESRMKGLRALSDYKLSKDDYVIFMLDGRSFGKYCKQFTKPFSDIFINAMNETAKYLCENIEGCKFAYVQSDEISLFVYLDPNESSPWFSYRLCKLQSISASLATSKFNQLMAYERMKKCDTLDNAISVIKNMPLVEFDAKVWNVPSKNDVFSWFLYRQLDCVKNSKQMVSQEYFSAKELNNLNTDEQIKLVKDEMGVDWNGFTDDKKFGRFLYKEEFKINKNNISFTRNKWVVHNAFQLFSDSGKEEFFKLNLFDKINNV